jgi:hypothetical protein
MNSKEKVVPMFFRLIRESLLSQRWQDTLNVLIALINESVGTSNTIFRVSQEGSTQ